ncbi:thioredoxin [Pseudoalteromonas sp. KS88]|uniref:TlpA family protein disulfide reductase n=1 Tax=Pseudoalteromonas sp. KS88 TaxID=2109918 RepID=UPI00107FD509|nr:thioredoxin [Pseudoalteromonas sp. KS88]TGE84682.1 thioredoxin [Pseudoalteromonas sp. KS88]
MFKQFLLVLALFVAPLAMADKGPFVGEISTTRLLADYAKFNKEFTVFTPSNDELAKIQQLDGKDIVVLFGTWCHDSEREVPRLLKLIAQSEVALKSLTLVGVGYDKRDPQGIAQQYNLEYTPTMIVLDDGKEIARMIEKPKVSLASDLSQFNSL